MAYTLQNIIERLLPDALGVDPSQFEADSDSAFSYDNCVSKINEASLYIGSYEAVINSRYLRAEYDFSISTLNQPEVSVALPENFHLPFALTKIQSLSTPWIIGNIYLQEPSDAGNYNSLINSYNLKDDSLVIFGADWSNYRLTYIRQPGSLCFGAVASGSTTTSVNVTVQYGSLSPGDDLYVGDKLGITRANGFVEIQRITGFNYSTSTFTTNAFSFTPTTTDKFSIMPFLPAVNGDLFVLGAAMRFPNVQDRAQSCGGRFQMLMDRFKENAGHNESNSPKPVLQVYKGITGVGANQPWWGGGVH